MPLEKIRDVVGADAVLYVTIEDWGQKYQVRTSNTVVQARARVLVRIERLRQGHRGDVKPVGRGVSELRIDYGPGYRVYFVRRGAALVLLNGGDKRTQAKDIELAIRLARDL